MKFEIRCQLEYSQIYSTIFVFNIGVVENQYQRILGEQWHIDPPLTGEEYISPSLKNRYLRLLVPGNTLRVQYEVTVEVFPVYVNPATIAAVPLSEIPLAVFHYLYPSRYCESDRLLRLVQHEFGKIRPGYSQVMAICDWIYENVTYLFGASNTQTSAYDTATERAGVCRDFAHLGIAFCRALNIPARFVTGYAYGLDPADFHAYFEAYLGNRWYIFDPTRLVPRTGLIRIGTGLDAADVSFATIFGSAELESMNLSIQGVPGYDPALLQLSDLTEAMITADSP